ncbi:MAG: glycerophosphoryl diester phosphodiesterase [Pseudonocardiales bacterium]|nr:glycerophosphoryl diester phosphodiesterase [Pseudonocardiales bacterium]
MRSIRPALAALGVAVIAATLVTSASAAPTPADQHRSTSSAPLVFGHRGAAGYRPEHTTAGYELAARMGADYIEPDLVPTKDGVLVDRHEPEISQTTDVASHPEFASRKTTKTIDGVVTTGWFTTDFTLAELKTLRAIERLPDIRQHNTMYDGRYQVLTLQEDINLWRTLAKKFNRQLGLVPEIKHSTYFRSLGLPMEQRVLTVLHNNGLDHEGSGIVIQSFEVGNLQWLHRQTQVALMQLTSATGAPADFVASGDPRTYADLCTAAGLKSVARYATFLGPDKNQIVPRDAAGKLLAPTSLIHFAHEARLLVAPYTFRNENNFLPLDFRRGTNPADYGDAFAEYKLFYALGVDGVFSDDSDTAIAARDEWLAGGAHRAA